MKNKIILFTTSVIISLSTYAEPNSKKATVILPNPNMKPALALPQKISSVEGVTEYKLANGLRVLLFTDKSKDIITVNITYLVGSRHEGYGETGMAHLLEHLMFKGSTLHPNIPQELASHGAKPNGTTWFDRTNYFETFAATDENLSWALDLEADRMVNSFIAKKDLDSEFSVVRNEFERGENNPSDILQERVFSTAYLWHNYGKSTIGARSDIEQVPIERLQSFYHTYYQPQNAVLIVSGKFDTERTLKLIHDKFAYISPKAGHFQKTYTSEPTQDGEREVTLRRVGNVQVVACAYHISPGSHRDFAPLEILNSLLVEEPSGYLYKKLIDTKLATSLSGFNYELKEPSMAYFSAEVLKENNIKQVRDTLLNTIENFYKLAITKDEVERIKNKILKGIELRLNSVEQINLALSEYIAQGDWRLLFYSRDQLKKVSVEDVLRVAKYYFKSNNRTLGYFYPTEKPDRVEIPAEPNITEMLKDYTGSEEVSEGEVFDPTPKNIANRTQYRDFNGVKLALLPKKTRGKEVHFSMNLHFGDEKVLHEKSTIAEYTGALLMKGTKHKTQQQIQDELTRLKADMNVSGGNGSIAASIKTKRENLSDVLKLMQEVLQEPAFNTNELEKLKNESIASIEQQKTDPQAIALQTIKRHLFSYPKGHPNYIKTFDEQISDIKSVSIEQIRQFYTEFYAANMGEISIVGDFEIQPITNDIETLLKHWKNNQKFKRIEGKLFSPNPINQKLETPDKANGFFVVFQELAIDQNDVDYPALVMANYMLGGGFLNSRLATRIRQKEGISYGVGSQLSVSALDKASYFVSYAIYAPENLERLENAYREEIEKMLTLGFSEAELSDAKKGYLQNRKMGRSQDASLAGTLVTYAYINRDIMWDENFEIAIDKLSVQEVNQIVKKYINYSKMNFVKAGDFAKKK